jgi:hypothetical protein
MLRNCFYKTHICNKSWCSSVTIVSDYRLVDEVQSPAEAKDFSSTLCVQTGSEVHPASYPMDTGVLSRE